MLEKRIVYDAENENPFLRKNPKPKKIWKAAHKLFFRSHHTHTYRHNNVDREFNILVYVFRVHIYIHFSERKRQKFRLVQIFFLISEDEAE